MLKRFFGFGDDHSQTQLYVAVNQNPLTYFHLFKNLSECKVEKYKPISHEEAAKMNLQCCKYCFNEKFYTKKRDTLFVADVAAPKCVHIYDDMKQVCKVQRFREIAVAEAIGTMNLCCDPCYARFQGQKNECMRQFMNEIAPKPIESKEKTE